jgi:2-haloalkanoic acid dehalogenase type II
MQPRLLSFDVFGTVVDWRRGLLAALGRQGIMVPEPAFDEIIDAQALDERAADGEGFRTYAEITARSLERELGLAPEAAAEIADGLGEWPIFSDSPAALERLVAAIPCVATTNSDRAHRAPVERRLGITWSAWICAEELRLYKPDERFFRRTAERLGETLSKSWWHVSAYADHDLDVARRLGLTTVFVDRPHARPGGPQAADHRVGNLLALADLLAPGARPAAASPPGAAGPG